MAVEIRKVVQGLYPERFGTSAKPVVVKQAQLVKRPNGSPAHRRVPQRKRSRTRIILLLLIPTLAGYVGMHIYYYNKFVTMSADIHAARSQVDVQLQRRKDIVASLNAVVVAYAKHEKEIFEHSIDTRKDMVHPTPALAEQGKDAQGQSAAPPLPGFSLDTSLSRILAVAEAFPGLRLSENYQKLMDALVEVETKLAEQRMALNHATNDMSTAICTFPALWYNRFLRFEVPDFYAADPDAAKPITLDLEPR